MTTCAARGRNWAWSMRELVFESLGRDIEENALRLGNLTRLRNTGCQIAAAGQVPEREKGEVIRYYQDPALQGLLAYLGGLRRGWRSMRWIHIPKSSSTTMT